MGEKLPRILPKVATSTSLLGSFTCSKFITWDRRLYFPSEGRRAEDFFSSHYLEHNLLCFCQWGNIQSDTEWSGKTLFRRYAPCNVTTFLASPPHLANLSVVKSEDMSTCWPPRSPDLSPLHFLLWCRFKFAVYVNPRRAFEALKERIQDKCEKIKLCTFGISSSRIGFIPIVKIVNQLIIMFQI